MEIVDELMTPGCPNCAKKHLSAAVERVVDGFNIVDYTNADVETILARAYINFVEAAEGYRSHRDYAIGLMVAAEERLIRRNDSEYAKNIRTIRTDIMTGVSSLEPLYYLCVSRLSVAHVYEAFRELPELSGEFNRNDFGSCNQQTVDWLVKMINWIDQKYFTIPEEPEEGGEEVMANCKKAAKAACKGGKCAAPAKKAPCKGGKCKK